METSARSDPRTPEHNFLFSLCSFPRRLSSSAFSLLGLLPSRQLRQFSQETTTTPQCLATHPSRTRHVLLIRCRTTTPLSLTRNSSTTYLVPSWNSSSTFNATSAKFIPLEMVLTETGRRSRLLVVNSSVPRSRALSCMYLSVELLTDKTDPCTPFFQPSRRRGLASDHIQRHRLYARHAIQSAHR